MSKNLYTVGAALIAVSMMICSCGKKPNEEQINVVTRDPNIPDNIITQEAPETLPEPGTSISETLPETEPEATTAEETTAEETSIKETEPPETDVPETEEEEEVPEALDTKAGQYLSLLHSKKVHAKYIAASSYDGEQIYTNSAEYYIDGDNAIYRTDTVRRLVQGRQVTVIDDGNKFYMTFEAEPEPYIYFGWQLSDYTLVSATEDEEVYDIESGGVRSTWNFEGGQIKVRDVYPDGSFMLYDFETLDSDTSEMLFEVPSGYAEVDADDYEMYQ